jgi:glutaredoxin
VAARIVFYTKDGCSLCERAQALLDSMGIDYLTVLDDPRFVERVPVVELDGRIVAEAPIDEPALRRTLARL